ncbi:hypothetical protein AB1Y20_017712 [Prymnesium parvum]|uniref:Uncharacterized protein n=1 Tax=Prymnesium parvum TaxID=97485 RepID=A0AB34JME6_PRYPA|mmetsp:Transcript_4191/g.8973  ORF Transcript_4191/g.8973 Transcript_4191/m.8973 type:complete len:275 (-) Transcript_4191:68-892(-)
MLEAGWAQFRGEYFRLRVELASKELEYLTSRFNSLVLAASVLAGFAFTALVELDINEEIGTNLEKAGYEWMEEVYYINVACTMAFSLYIIVIASVAIMKAQRMAVHGNVDMAAIQSELPDMLGGAEGMIDGHDSHEPPADRRADVTQSISSLPSNVDSQRNDDVQQALQAMRAVQPSLLISFGFSLFNFVLAAVAMGWIKTVSLHLSSGYAMNHMALALSCVFVALLFSLAGVTLWMWRLFRVKKYHTGNMASPSPYLQQLRQPLVPSSAGAVR